MPAKDTFALGVLSFLICAKIGYEAGGWGAAVVGAILGPVVCVRVMLWWYS